VDWFHLNSSVYDPRDGSLLLSSRESFVVKLDHETGELRWLLGDPTKHWHSFPSLRALALEVTGGMPPIGQHALSLTEEGWLLLFDNGYPSLPMNQPDGAPLGISRPYSRAVAYEIDEASRTAREAWSFDHGGTIASPICSGVERASDGSAVVLFSSASNGNSARLVGIDAQGRVAFDFEYETRACETGWHVQIVPFESLVFP
jgi:hypothetical protein